MTRSLTCSPRCGTPQSRGPGAEGGRCSDRICLRTFVTLVRILRVCYVVLLRYRPIYVPGGKCCGPSTFCDWPLSTIPKSRSFRPSLSRGTGEGYSGVPSSRRCNLAFSLVLTTHVPCGSSGPSPPNKPVSARNAPRKNVCGSKWCLCQRSRTRTTAAGCYSLQYSNALPISRNTSQIGSLSPRYVHTHARAGDCFHIIELLAAI